MAGPKHVSPIEKVWLIEQFDQINKKLDLLLKRSEPNPYVIPELESIIGEVSKRAKSIDYKVPDKNVPPGSSPPGSTTPPQ